jgi:hypothetical protein
LVKLRDNYLRRKMLVHSQVQSLEFLKILVDIVGVLSGKVDIQGFNHGGKHTYVLSNKDNSITVSDALFQKATSFLNISKLNVRLFALYDLFNESSFQSHVHEKVVDFMKTEGMSRLNQLLKEQKSYKSIDLLLEQYDTLTQISPLSHKPISFLTEIRPDNSNQSIETIVAPIREKSMWHCPYCLFTHETNSEVMKHIHSVHVNITRKMYTDGLRIQYKNYIQSLFEGYMFDTNTKSLIKLTKPRTDPIKMTQVNKIDKHYNMFQVYTKYCDANMGITRYHDFVEGVCIHCNRSIAKIHHDASQFNTDRVQKHEKALMSYVKKLTKRYCLTKHPLEIRESRRNKSGKMVPIDKLYTVDQLWHKLRKSNSFVVIDNVINIMKQYSDYFKHYVLNQEVSLDALDKVSDLHYTKQPQTSLQYQHPENYLEMLSTSYNLSKDVQNKIFGSSKIVSLDNKLKQTKDVKEADKYKQEITSLVSQQVVSMLNEFSKVSSSGFVSDLLDNVPSDKFGSMIGYQEIIQDLEKRNKESEFFNKRDNVLRYVIKDLLKYLRLAVKQHPEMYHTTCHLMSN